MSSIPSSAAPAVRSGARQLVLALSVVGVALFGLTTIITGAFFTDSKTVDNNTFSTGSVTLGTNPSSAAVSFSANMSPGDVVTAPLTISNSGSLSLRYSMLSTTTEASLSAQLQMTVKTGITAANCTTANFGSSGTAAYGPGVLGSTGGTKVLGDAAQGNQTGDRTLAAGANEVLCIQVSLPTSTGNAFQGKTTTAAFKFDGEQTTNNP